MFAVLLYMMVGALLMATTFKVNKLKETLPLWYANYTVAMIAEGKEYVNRETFDKTVFVAMFLLHIFGWPSVVWILIGKIIKDFRK